MDRKEALKKELEELRGNAFLENAERIKELCENGKWDVGVAMDKLIAENDTENFTHDEAEDFRGLLRKFSLNEVVEARAEM